MSDDILKSAKSLGQLNQMVGGSQKISGFYLDRINDLLRDSLLSEKEHYIGKLQKQIKDQERRSQEVLQ